MRSARLILAALLLPAALSAQAISVLGVHPAHDQSDVDVAAWRAAGVALTC